MIASAIDGTVTLLNNEIGELVLGTFNNLGQTILEIADLSHIIMRAEVDEGNIQLIQPGQRATVFVTAYPGREFPGRVDKVRPQKRTSPRVAVTTARWNLVELCDDEQLLLVGGLANRDIHVETMVDVLKVPSQAVVDRRIDELPAAVTAGVQGIGRNKAFARVVYKLVNGEAVAVPVVAGSSDLRSTVVLQGLASGDRIITGPYKVLATLKHGQKVEEDAPAAVPGDRAAAGVAQSSGSPGAGANGGRGSAAAP